MGQVIDVKCNKCGYSERFYLGMGMRDWDKAVVAGYFESCRAKEILDSGDSWCFNWKLARCNDCKRLLRVPVLDGLDEDKGRYEFIGAVCCGQPIDEIIDVPEQVGKLYTKCPKCEDELEASETMLWD